MLFWDVKIMHRLPFFPCISLEMSKVRGPRRCRPISLQPITIIIFSTLAYQGPVEMLKKGSVFVKYSYTEVNGTFTDCLGFHLSNYPKTSTSRTLANRCVSGLLFLLQYLRTNHRWSRFRYSVYGR